MGAKNCLEPVPEGVVYGAFHKLELESFRQCMLRILDCYYNGGKPDPYFGLEDVPGYFEGEGKLFRPFFPERVWIFPTYSNATRGSARGEIIVQRTGDDYYLLKAFHPASIRDRYEESLQVEADLQRVFGEHCIPSGRFYFNAPNNGSIEGNGGGQISSLSIFELVNCLFQDSIGHFQSFIRNWEMEIPKTNEVSFPWCDNSGRFYQTSGLLRLIRRKKTVFLNGFSLTLSPNINVKASGLRGDVCREALRESARFDPRRIKVGSPTYFQLPFSRKMQRLEDLLVKMQSSD